MGLWSAMRSRLLCRLVAVLMTVGVGSVIALTLELASPTEAFAKDKAKKKKPKKFTYAQRGNSAKVSVRARKPARTRVETPRFYSKEVKTIGELEPISLKMQDGVPVLTEIPRFSSQFQGRIAGRTPDNKVLYFTIDPGLQAYAQQLVDRAAAPDRNVTTVTGRVKAPAAAQPGRRPGHAPVPPGRKQREPDWWRPGRPTAPAVAGSSAGRSG